MDRMRVTTAGEIDLERSRPTGTGRQSLRLMISSAGRRVGLLQCFRNSAAELGVDLTVMACDANPEMSSACHLADRRERVPPANAPGYADALLAICERWGIDLLVPTIDTELPALARARPRFAASGVMVAISDAALVDIARDKLATARHFADHNVPTPASARIEDVLTIGWTSGWPVIVKPRGGSASRAISIAERESDLPRRWDEPMLVQRLLRGAEYTINLYFDRRSVMRCAITHARLQVRAGEVEKGATVRLAPLQAIVERLPPALPGARGALCVQAIVGEGGEAALFEINARFGGGYPLAHHAGAPFTRWLLEERLGRRCSAHDQWREGVTMLRYDAAVLLG